jgi:reactive intermediate/imine deaminase
MKKITPLYLAENKGHYSPGIVSNGMLYVSGQLSIDPDTRRLPEGGLEAQVRQALANLDRVLREAGLGRASVVLCRVYIADIEGWDTVNRIYAEFFGNHKPARVVVPTGRLHFGCLVEIEAMAEIAAKD